MRIGVEPITVSIHQVEVTEIVVMDSFARIHRGVIFILPVQLLLTIYPNNRKELSIQNRIILFSLRQTEFCVTCWKLKYSRSSIVGNNKLLVINRGCQDRIKPRENYYRTNLYSHLLFFVLARFLSPFFFSYKLSYMYAWRSTRC